MFLTWCISPFHATNLSITPENISKHLVFWCFQGVQKEIVAWNRLAAPKTCQFNLKWMFTTNSLFEEYLYRKTAWLKVSTDVLEFAFQFSRQKKSSFKKYTTYSLLSLKSYVCLSGGKKCSFFGKFGVLCFLETTVLKFALLPYYRQNIFIFA